MSQTVRMRWPDGRLHAFTMSYDDGRMEDNRLAALMKKYGLKGTFNINTGIYWKEDEPDPAQSCFVMKQPDLAELLLLIPEKTPGEILK